VSEAKPEMGQPLRRFLLAINLMGVVSVASGVANTHALAHPPSLLRLLAAGTAFVVGELALLHIRIGDENHSFTWSEAAMIIGMVLLPSPWARIVGPLGVAAVHLYFRRPAVKVLFNAMSFATALVLARIAFNAVGGADPGLQQMRTWLALTLASLVFFVWNGGTVATAVALSQGLRLRDVYRRGLGLSAFVWLGNTTFGVVVVTAAAHDRRLLAVVPVFLVFLYVADRGYLRATEERDQWRLLQQASSGLVSVDGDALLTQVLDGTRELLRSDVTELELCVEGSVALYRSAADGQRDRLPASTAPLELATQMEAALVDQRGVIGYLRAGFRSSHKVSDRDHHVLSAFASQVATALGNARLFSEVSAERAKLEQIVENTSDGIFLVDGSGIVVSWNAAMARITGRPASDAVGATVFDGISALTDTGSRATVEWLREVWAASSPGSAMVQVTPHGSEVRWLNLSVAAAHGNDDDDSLVVVARDVTSLREADEAKQEFVATVSHELRTPLTPLKGFLLTLLRDDFNPGPEQRDEILRRMLQQADRLEVLIEDLLNMSRLERGEFRIEPSVVELDSVIDAVIADRQRPVGRSGLYQLSALADEGRLVQVLTNLVSNAEKYSPADGSIDISVHCLTNAKDPAAPGVIEIAVSDQGCGIPEDQREAVFDRFRRLGNHLTREQGGTGLGLYIARRLVESMGGRIWVEGQLGEGSTFVFTLPMAQAATGWVPTVVESDPADTPAAEPVAQPEPRRRHPALHLSRVG
jgi:PAS domain S-box-containing protein